MNRIMKKCTRAELMLMFILTVLFPVVLAAQEMSMQPAADISGEQLVAQIIEAYGGRDNLAKVRSIYTRSYEKIHQADNDGWITANLQRPDRFRIESALHQTNSTRVVSGSQVWMSSGKALLEPADNATREGVMFLFNCIDLPFSLAEGKWTAKHQGIDKHNSSPNQVLILKNSAGEELTLTVNPKTHLIDLISGITTKGERKIIIAQEYSDYREVNGIKLPFRITSYYDGKPYAQNTLGEVKINVEMPDKLYKP